MPKGRMLNKKISRSEKVATLSIEGALLFSWCIPHLDREGRMYADIKSIKGIVVPYLDYMTDKIIERCRQEIHDSGLATLYRQDRYFQFNGFSDNQRIDKSREAESEIPAPTPEELQRNSRVTPDTSKVKLSKDNKEQQPTAALTAALDKVYKDNFNIYALINRVKKELKWGKDQKFPDPVLLAVCGSYWKDKANIKDQWPWFITVLKQESAKYYSMTHIQEHEKIKEENKKGCAVSLADILGRIKQ